MNKKGSLFLKLILVGWLALLTGGVAGFWLAIKQVNVEIQVDFDSCATRRLVKVGSFVIREEEYRLNRFSNVTMKNGSASLTGAPNWQAAVRFYGNSQRSKIGRGDLLSDIAALNGWKPCWDDVNVPNIHDVKEKILVALASGRIDAVHSIVNIVML